MKCPVCKNTIINNVPLCQHCGFTDLHREFINRQDVQDWEENVVYPYRDKWLHGVLNAEEWLERIYNFQKLRKDFERDRVHRLSPANLSELLIDSPEQIYSLTIASYDGELDNELVKRIKHFHNLKKLRISFQYRGIVTAEGVNAITHACPNLTELSITHTCDCDMLSKLDLSNIETLWFSCEEFTPVLINAPVLKELTIDAAEIEDRKKTSKDFMRSYVDFSGMPSLETFVSYRCYHLDYSSLSSLPRLKHIRITDQFITGLSWVSKMYQLEELAVWGKVVSLSGIECQPNLKKLQLQYNTLKNVIELAGLHHLEYLDLYRNDIADENYIRQLNIPTTIITKQDKELHEIEDGFVSVYGLGFLEEVNRWMLHWDKQDERTVAPYLKRKLQRWKNLTYSEKAKEAVQTAFSVLYVRLCEGNYQGISNPTNQHKCTYVKSGLKYYPFLELTYDMKADIAKGQLSL